MYLGWFSLKNMLYSMPRIANIQNHVDLREFSFQIASFLALVVVESKNLALKRLI